MTGLGRRLALLPHAAFKARQALRTRIDDHGGWNRAMIDAEVWVRNWEERFPTIGDWLDRPGAGRLWVDHHAGPRWAAQRTTPDDIALADAVVDGVIPRLGAEARVGNPPVWRRDGYTGREWALEPARQVHLVRGDGSDIRTVWELSRCYHFVTLARAYWRTRDPRYLLTFQAHVESWLGDNPPGQGPNWASPMDVAIRSANWALALVLLAGAPGVPRGLWAAMLANLRLSAWYVARYPEWHFIYRGNHFISNGVGLVYVGALFRNDRFGDRWLRAGAAILRREMRYQVHPDGTSFEASTGYHRLVTEFFAWGGTVVRRNLRGALPTEYWTRLHLMRQFLETCLDVDGQAPLLGDADDGRLHHLCAASVLHPRKHRLGLPTLRGAVEAPQSRSFPDGGFHILRNGADRCIVRCGPVGLRGAGSHDHNDQLSFELVLSGREVVLDSGTYAYTRDLRARLEFRATAAHNAVQLGGEEQNPIRVDRPWRVLADRTQATCTTWEVDDHGTVFEGRHHGFAHRPSRAICSRRITVDAATGGWTIADVVAGTGKEALAWRLHLAPGLASLTLLQPGHWLLEHANAPRHRVTLEAPGELDARLTESPYSECYGEMVVRPMVLLEGRVTLPVTITLRISPTSAQPGGGRA